MDNQEENMVPREKGSKNSCTCQEGLCTCCGGCSCYSDREEASMDEDSMPREKGTDTV